MSSPVNKFFTELCLLNIATGHEFICIVTVAMRRLVVTRKTDTCVGLRT